MRVVAPQLVVWSIFWPTALVCLRAGIKWADTYVVKSGLGLPSEAAERREKPEVDGDERRDV